MPKLKFNIDGLILSLIGLMVLYLFWNDYLIFYIYPAYNGLVFVAAVLTLLFGLYNFVQTKQDDHCGCNDSSSNAAYSILKLLLFAPILIGLLLPPKPLSVELALTRGVSFELEANRQQSIFDTFTTNPENRTLFDWIRVLTANPEPDTYLDQKVNLTGFLIYPKDYPDQVYISQFIISCCAADARPISLPVLNTELFQDYTEGDWISLLGSMQVYQSETERKAIVKAEKIQAISPPKNPYVYQ